MQKVQVYIGSDRLDLFSDENLSINQSIQNIKDISKVFTPFSQTFSVPASPNNNKIFKHYYNYNIVGGFDARQKASSSIELNYIPWKSGFIALNGVDLKNNVAHTYRITFYGETVNLKDILGEDMLSDLSPLSAFNLIYDSATVKSKLTDSLDNATAKKNGATTNSTALVVDNNSGTIAVGDVINCEGVNGVVTITTVTDQNNLVMSTAQTIADNVDIVFSKSVCAPLITHTKRFYYDSASSAAGNGNLYYDNSLQTQGVDPSDLKYSLRIDRIIQAIESNYTIANNFASNIVFSKDFFSSSNINYFNLFLWLHRKKGSVQPTTQITEYISQVNGFTQTSSGTTKTAINSAGDTLSIYTQNIVPPNAINTNFLYLTRSTTEEYQVYIYRNSALFYVSEVTSSTSFTIGQPQFGTLLPGSYTVSIRQTGTTDITFSTIKWEINGVDGGVSYQDKYTSTNFSTETDDVEFNITEQIPEMKVIDFLTGLFKMFNLTAFVEDGVIVVKTLDEYYQLASTWNTTNTLWQNDDTLWNEAGTTGSTTYSLDEFIDVNSSQVNIALPFKQVNFEYEGLGTFLAKQYEQLNNVGWGTERYTLDSETYDTPNEVYKVQLPFEHVQYERLVNGNGGVDTTAQYGYFVDQNEQSYFGKPLLFYPIRQVVSDVDNQRISFRDTSSSNSKITNYIIPSNSVSLSSTTDTSNINFSLEINEYQLDSSFTGTLFATYYENYIAEIFNTKRRLIRVTAYLPLNMIYNLELNDTIEINYENYRINSIQTDLTNGKSNIELINIV